MSQARGRRYDVATMQEARRLFDGGWSPHQIRQILLRRGLDVSRRTITRWVDPRAAERQREADRRAKAARRARSGSWFRADATVEFRMARLRELAEVGVPHTSAAKVLTLAFGVEVTEWMVRKALHDGTVPRPWRPRLGVAA